MLLCFKIFLMHSSFCSATTWKEWNWTLPNVASVRADFLRAIISQKTEEFFAMGTDIVSCQDNYFKKTWTCLWVDKTKPNFSMFKVFTVNRQVLTVWFHVTRIMTMIDKTTKLASQEDELIQVILTQEDELRTFMSRAVNEKQLTNCIPLVVKNHYMV